MRYCDFKKLEASFYFMMKIKNGDKKPSKDVNETKRKISQLDTIDIEEVASWGEEYAEFLKE